MYSVTGFRITVSFSRTAARTMEPAVGASLWALGSHRCSPYRSIFTRNAVMQASHRRELDHELVRGWTNIGIIRKFSVPVVL